MGEAATKSSVNLNKSMTKNNPNGRCKSPGVRFVGGRIYDSHNGKTCHQCRQKTLDFVASCKNQNGNKTCPINYCYKCLLNRYGEKAEEVSTLDDWNCPRCRGICNCSLCMKKRGHQPTGILVRTAKENGFSSVSDLLQVKGPECVGLHNNAKDMGVSWVKHNSSRADIPTSLTEEDSFDGKTDHPSVAKETSISKEKKSTKTKRNRLTNGSNASCDDDAGLKGYSKKLKSAEEVNRETESDDMKTDIWRNVESCSVDHCGEVLNNEEVQNVIELPPSVYLTSVAGVDLAPEDVGQALQFLEFCSSFCEVLNINKGQAEAVLGEILNSRGRSRSQHPCVASFHIQLLCVIQKDLQEESPVITPTDDKHSWFQALGDYISDCQFNSKKFPSDCFDKGNEGYDALDVSKKLKLLNFLCDEALNTSELRGWVNEQWSKSLERRKDAKEKVLAAKQEEKQVKKKVQDEIARAILAKTGAPLSISEHESIVLQIKTEAAQAHAKVVEAMGLAPKGMQFLFSIL